MLSRAFMKIPAAVIHNVDLSAPFTVNTGVRTGCILSLLIVSLVIVWVMKTTMEQPRGIQWTLMQKLEDLDFADDVSLLSHIRDAPITIHGQAIEVDRFTLGWALL